MNEYDVFNDIYIFKLWTIPIFWFLVFTLNSINCLYACYLLPYSPALNPIEEVFSSLKARYYQIRQRPESSREVFENVRTIIEEMNSDGKLNLNNFYINMRKYLSLAFIGEFFLVYYLKCECFIFISICLCLKFKKYIIYVLILYMYILIKLYYFNVFYK